ncbi:hypothetical protein LTR85_010359 [Meristemomyces frigidus]|nr:hypothetical protein LTR85_010359 [Meristemomyces frigidus]
MTAQQQQQQSPPLQPMINYASPVYQPAIPAQQQQYAPAQQPQQQQPQYAPVQQPQQQPMIDYESLKFKTLSAPLAPAPTQALSTYNTTTTIQTQTLVYEGSTSGGEARKAAESRGAVGQFEDGVQSMIVSMNICPATYKWYSIEQGYVCAGGNHFIRHAEIDKRCKDPNHRPQVTLVNTFSTPTAKYCGVTGQQFLTLVHPPAVDFWQPMHRVHARFIRQSVASGYGPVSADGKCECFQRMGIPSTAESWGMSDEAMGKLVDETSYTGRGQNFGFGPTFHQ